MEGDSSGRPGDSPRPGTLRDGLKGSFSRRILDGFPSPAMVVDGSGNVTYVNDAMSAMSGWPHDELVGANILDHLHPDDAEWVVEAFFQLAEQNSPPDPEEGAWGSIRCRIITKSGAIVPLEVTGNGDLLDDPDVGGLVYDVRPVHVEELLRRGLNGVARGEPIGELLDLVADLMAAPPFDFEAVILDCAVRNHHEVVAASDERLRGIFDGARDPVPWSVSTLQPTRAQVDELPRELGRRLVETGYLECWHVSIVGAHPSSAYRLISCTPTVHRPANSVLQRIEQARELAAVVLARSHTDRLLEHAARHDSLTGLPNRLAFYRELERLEDEGSQVGVLYIDLDDFKPVNDGFGHAAGDAVLEDVALRLREATRANDFVARVGGDEFAVLLTDDVETGVAESVGARINEVIAEPIAIGGPNVAVSASVGAVLGNASIGADRLVAAADRAMYEAKAEGGDRLRLGSLDTVMPGPADPA